MSSRTSPAWAHTPLGSWRLEADCAAYLPSSGRAGYASPLGPSKGPVAPAAWQPAHALAALPVPEGLTRPVDAWCTHSNGRVEAKAFASNQDFSVVHPTMLGPMGLLCLDGGALTSFDRISPGQALAVLFAAAVQGGTYGGALDLAAARLAAWTSLGVLCGARHEPKVITKVAEASSFVRFDARSAWFRQIAWDLGILCLRGDARTIVVLAATDQD